MADAPRTIADLIANLFQDGQANGSISEQDMRDLILTFVPSIGGIYFSTPVETVIATVSTKVLALGATTLISLAHDIDMPTNNRIRYTGPNPRHFSVDVALSTTAAGNNKLIEYQLCKNGVLLPETLMKRTHGTGSQHGALAITTNLHMENGDYLELWVSNESDNTNLTIENGTINLSGSQVE